MRKSIIQMLVICVFASCTSTPSKQYDADSFARAVLDTTSVPDTKQKASPELSNSWNYQEEEDKMTSKKDYYASVQANELLYFQSPYDGGATATFTIRRSGKFGLDTYLRVSEGQFHGDYGNPTVLIRLDDAPAKTYSYSKSADGSYDIIFIDGASSLITKIKKAKKMLIEAEFYSNGRKQMEFDVHDLDWKH